MTRTREILEDLNTFSVNKIFTSNNFSNDYRTGEVTESLTNINCVKRIGPALGSRLVKHKLLFKPTPTNLEKCSGCRRLGIGGCPIFEAASEKS